MLMRSLELQVEVLLLPACIIIIFLPHAEAADSRPLTESDSDSDGEVGASAPPLTKQISNILNRYPEGGQILKVCKNSINAEQSEFHDIAAYPR